jgi:hypothetical protein
MDKKENQLQFSLGVFVDCLISMEKMDWSPIFSEKSGIFKYSAKTVETMYTLPFTIKTIDSFTWNTELVVHFLRKKKKFGTTRLPKIILSEYKLTILDHETLNQTFEMLT